MTLEEVTEIWEIKNPAVDFWDVLHVHKAVDRNALINYLMYEFRDMTTIDSDSGQFRNHMKNFFDIHKWNIDKLGETLLLKYYTLENVRFHQHQQRDETKDTDFISEKKSDDDETTDRTINKTGTEHTKDTLDREWTENGNEDKQNVHFVSAFNDYPSPTGNPPRYVDTEQYRDTESSDYYKEGTQDDKRIIDTKTTDDTGDGTVRSETIKDDFNSTEQMIDDTHTDTDRVGHDGGSYQSLIEEERKQAQFNIYKWIGRHFARELLVSLW